MITADQVQSLLGSGGNVVGQGGQEIGAVGQVHLDDDSGQPGWSTVSHEEARVTREPITEATYDRAWTHPRSRRPYPSSASTWTPSRSPRTPGQRVGAHGADRGRQL